jgi:amyloid beta precursor protein binding protein 1
MTDDFPVALVGPSSKERRYDRQLRLWAASGQQALEQSRVLLVNSDGFIDGSNTPVGGVAGIETLKNLVLPGVGGFTIVDPAVVSETDLGINFFLEESSLGKPRAQETCTFLKELNPDVDGDFKTEVDLTKLLLYLLTDFSPLHSQSQNFFNILIFFKTINW